MKMNSSPVQTLAVRNVLLHGKRTNVAGELEFFFWSSKPEKSVTLLKLVLRLIVYKTS